MSDNSVSLQQLAKVSQGAARYLPEPATSGVGLFKDVMDTVGTVGQAALGTAVPGLSDFGSFEEMLALQLDAQKEMQTITMVSNIERNKHETKMTPLRNIRS